MTCLPAEKFLVALVELFNGIPLVRLLGDQCSLLQEWQYFCETILGGKVRNLFEKLGLLNAVQGIVQPRDAIIRIVMLWGLVPSAGLLFTRTLILVPKVAIR